MLPAAHTVPAVGFALHDGRSPELGAWVFSGDTGPNPALWARLAQMRVHTLVIETAFGDEDIELARISRHLSPTLLREELAQLGQPADVYITHIKPGELDAGDGRDRRAGQPAPHPGAACRAGDGAEPLSPVGAQAPDC